MQAFKFHPIVTAWFERRFGSPTPPQQEGWPAIAADAHTLIAAPTGSGKTLAAFLASLDQLFRLGMVGNLRGETYIVYVSPLKALSNDIHKNLHEPLSGIREAIKMETNHDIEVRSAVRTGDTPASERVAIAKRPPHILVTTPESLYLLLTSVSGRKMLSTVRTLIVDEIHAVVGSRRGSHLALTMERLEALVGQSSRQLQRIGLSATQKPIEEVAKFLVGNRRSSGHASDLTNSLLNRPLSLADDPSNKRPTIPTVAAVQTAKIIDTGHSRDMDLAIELPQSALEAVMSNEVWEEVYRRLGELIEAHRTTLVFVNTRRLAERVTAHLGELLGRDNVTSHHGSLSTKLRLDAENRLKRGELKALVATSSLELGIDIGTVDLVCQVGSIRSISTCLQRIGRAGHFRGGLPKGRLFPLTRDELVECVATLQCIRRGELDLLIVPEKPLDVLAQQIVAAAAVEEWKEDDLLALVTAAFPYRNLTHQEFLEVLRMLSDGFSTKRGRRAALIHYDAINHRIRGRRGARLTALTSGGAIPDNADYRVVLEPAQTFIGTVNEDFAVESIAGDVFQLGNASWKILQIAAGTVRVEDAHGQPPGIPFWLGEAPARTAELSRAISELDDKIAARVTELSKSRRDRGAALEELADWFTTEALLSRSGALQLAAYFYDACQALGALPSEKTIIMERFFDESGGMQLVIHSRFGARLNRAWGLALRKRFCRSFNFELQSAATDDAIVLSLGTQHSFPLDEVFRYLNSKTVREILVQALLDSPMFPIRWRWNATRALALPRQRGGRKIAAPLQRMEAENLLAAVFPDQLACPENLVDDREVPDHPLVKQTIDDCLIEAMDIEGLEQLLQRIERGQIECIARDLPEPSPLASEILNARPYAFLDNAPLEERRAHAVQTRRAGDSGSSELGILDVAAIQRVCQEAWPQAQNADELHDAILQLGVATLEELKRCSPPVCTGANWIAELSGENRIIRLDEPPFWFAAERTAFVREIYPDTKIDPPKILNLLKPASEEEARKELVRGRMECIGPVTVKALADFFRLSASSVEQALLALEAEGFVLRGKFHPGATETEWCDRRLLARIHRLTINRLRAEIQPVSVADFQRFLLSWQHVLPEQMMEQITGLEAILHSLDGYELPAAAWEPAVLAARVKDYDPRWLDQLCFTGRLGWGRLSPPPGQKSRGFPPLRSSPISIFSRENAVHWLELANAPQTVFSSETESVLKALAGRGALFFGEIVRHTGLLKSRVEQALGELVSQGWVTADSFEGLRTLLTPPEKRERFGDAVRPRRHRAVTSIEYAGRWSLLRRYVENEIGAPILADENKPAAIESFARVLLRRYGVMFRKLLDREALKVSWFALGRVYRQMEARGEIRGGHFVSGVSGEQFALPEAIGHLRSLRKTEQSKDLVSLSGSDPLNLVGILTPGSRVPALWRNRVLLRDGVPVAALDAGKILNLDGDSDLRTFESALKIGKLPSALRKYYH
ncbi:MAG TPA: crosslink repair DNA glycosylase YcaQ family protein [Verrucomicrobiae bacterium]|nr:crosslink repair DNA glycosylase YcaQ family protein [Verrucomicrobiae bacterium]